MSRSAPGVCQNPDTAAIWPLLLDSPWFAGLTQASQAALLAQGRAHRLVAGSFVFFRGDPPDGLYAVLSGSVLIGSSNALGKAAVLARLGAGQWFGELGLFDHESRSHDAYTDEACLLWHATQAGMLALLAQQPEMWPALGRLLAGKTRKLMAGLHQHTLMSSAGRLAQRMLLLADGQPSLETGRRYRREILETGGSRPAMQSFTAFRGREPQLDALLALLQETERDGQEYDFPIPPHERAVAQAWGLNAAAPAWARRSSV